MPSKINCDFYAVEELMSPMWRKYVALISSILVARRWNSSFLVFGGRIDYQADEKLWFLCCFIDHMPYCSDTLLLKTEIYVIEIGHLSFRTVLCKKDRLSSMSKKLPALYCSKEANRKFLLFQVCVALWRELQFGNSSLRGSGEKIGLTNKVHADETPIIFWFHSRLPLQTHIWLGEVCSTLASARIEQNEFQRILCRTDLGCVFVLSQ